MPSDGQQLLDGYLALEQALGSAGRRATSPACLETLTRFWLSGKRRLVVRKGRQSGWSTTMERVVFATAMFGAHRQPPGTRLTIPILSHQKDDAEQRLDGIEDIAGAMDEPYRRAGDTIELTARGITFKAYAATKRARGMVSAAIVEDETCFWPDEDSENPANEIDAAIVPSLITQPNGRIYTISSPMGLDDFHATLFSRGETADQCVAEGPSWFWNPIFTEEDSHTLVGDAIAWLREMAAKPSAGKGAAFDPATVDAAFAPIVASKLGPTMGTIGIIDASNLLSDSFAWGVAAYRDYDGHRVLHLLECGAFEPADRERFPFHVITRKISNVFRHHKVRNQVVGDSHSCFAIASAFQAEGFAFTDLGVTAATKQSSVAYLRTLLTNGAVILPDDKDLRAELTAFRDNGRKSGSPRGQHDDLVSIVLGACMATEKGLLRGAPLETDTSPGAKMRKALNGKANDAAFWRQLGIF